MKKKEFNVIITCSKMVCQCSIIAFMSLKLFVEEIRNAFDEYEEVAKNYQKLINHKFEFAQKLENYYLCQTKFPI